ncbi:MAG: SocA family protein [Dehalococcoidia bacterium]|nr:SocA family protein [Dehalococcoidia bacterium]
MPTNFYRQKLLNAVLFFARNTKHVNLTRLLKLLYFLDFTHFKQTGYPSIGLRYYTFRKGPVPWDFWSEIKDGNVPDDFNGKFAMIPKMDDFAPDYKEWEIRAIASPDLSFFTPRETKIMEDLAFIYKDARAWQMSDVSHLPKQPWDITVKEKGWSKPIDYLLAIDDKSKVSLDEARDSLKEHFEVVQNLGIKPTK